MHKIADRLAGMITMPLLHIGDVTAERAQDLRVRRPLLLGTRYLMSETFYRERLERHGLDVVLPLAAGQDLVHRIIYEELMDGRVETASRVALKAIVEEGLARRADAVILACTELGLALRSGDVDVPLLDTAQLHVQAGVAFMLDDAPLASGTRSHVSSGASARA